MMLWFVLRFKKCKIP